MAARLNPRRMKQGLAGMAVLTAVVFVAGLKTNLEAPAPSHMMLDRHGDYLGEVAADEDALGYWPVGLDPPMRITQATLHTEDRYYWEHPGVHVPSVLRAMWQNVTSMRVVSGASTVAMQVARMQSPSGRTLWAKAQEAVEALLLIHQHGHQAVLRQYLTLAPYGNRVFGASRAARFYFDKPLEDLSWLQAAFLAGLPQGPGRLNPYTKAGNERARARALRILDTLKARGVITAQEHATAVESRLGLVRPVHRPREALHAALAMGELAGQREEAVVRTTLDLEVQRITARAVRDNLRLHRALGANNTAALVLDTQTGDVLAYVGSADYFDDENHGAVDYARMRRSPGSALKPFIYALAMDHNGWTPATPLADTPMEFQSEGGHAYLPENMNHAFLGPMQVRTALGNSRNIPALRALSTVGVERTLRLLEAGGVQGISWDPDAYGLGLALGNLPVTLRELSSLYLMLANGGETRAMRFFQADPVVPGKKLLTQTTAQLVTHILADGEARRPTFVGGGPLDFDYAVAVKTGTSQGHRDAWTVAFSDRLLVAVWLGNHDWRRMNRVSGALGAAPVAHRIMDRVMPLREPHRAVAASFPPPVTSEERTVCALSGALAGEDCPHHRAEHFAPGTAPQHTCKVHRRALVDRANGKLAGPACPPSLVETRVVVDLPPEYQAWARAQRFNVAPTVYSPRCPAPREAADAFVAITTPSTRARFLRDPDTPEAFSTVKLAAQVYPPEEDVVWLVDGTPVAKVGWPHEIRLPLTPGHHQIVAAMARMGAASQPVQVTVED